MKRAFVLCVLTAAGAWGSSAMAIGRLADVTVTDRATGVTLPVHYHRGEYWVAGTPGAKYAIDVRNATGRRVLAVTSVDGVNVVSGETASARQSGYVLAAWQRYGITGWRKGNDSVAAFEFTASPNSYAERTGRPRDVGVIGVALFLERVPVPVHVLPPPVVVPYHSRAESSGATAPSAPAAATAPPPPAAPSASPSAADAMAKSAAPSAQGAAGMAESAAPASRSGELTDSANQRAMPQATPKLGTGHGERESSYVSHTAFERERSTPNEVIRIRYDSRDNLIAMGVIPQYRTPQPNPFPDSSIGYVPDPPLYR